jgi:hypothetical protein
MLPSSVAAVVVTELAVPGPVAALVVTELAVPGPVAALVVTELAVPGPVAAVVVTELVMPGVAYGCLTMSGPVVMAAVIHSPYGRVVRRVGSVSGDGQRDRDACAAEDGCRRESDKSSGVDAAHGLSRDRKFEVTFVPYLRYVTGGVPETIALWSYDQRTRVRATARWVRLRPDGRPLCGRRRQLAPTSP